MAASMRWTTAVESDDDFVRRHREHVYRLALSIVGRREVAEDVAQDVLLRGLKHRRSVKDHHAWLRTATVRRAMSTLKTRATAPLTDLVNAGDIEGSAAVRSVLDQLPAEQRTLLALAVGEGWTYAEIAQALGVPEGTVGSRLHAAKAAFRALWGEER